MNTKKVTHYLVGKQSYSVKSSFNNFVEFVNESKVPLWKLIFLPVIHSWLLLEKTYFCFFSKLLFQKFLTEHLMKTFFWKKCGTLKRKLLG